MRRVDAGILGIRAQHVVARLVEGDRRGRLPVDDAHDLGIEGRGAGAAPLHQLTRSESFNGRSAGGPLRPATFAPRSTRGRGFPSSSTCNVSDNGWPVCALCAGGGLTTFGGALGGSS